MGALGVLHRRRQSPISISLYVCAIYAGWLAMTMAKGMKWQSQTVHNLIQMTNCTPKIEFPFELIRKCCAFGAKGGGAIIIFPLLFIFLSFFFGDQIQISN